ncbi:MAG: TatD family hydrolase [Planctomycetota bacterium]|nr:TatD family hydrolase [Planctomycetota bacterium]
MIDTHCHLTNSQLHADVKKIIDDAYSLGVRIMITVATDGDDSIAAMELAESDNRIYFSSGIHPLHAEGEWDWQKVQLAGRGSRCVAWGELGLDRYHGKPPLNLQMKLLEEHLAMIEDVEEDNRPIIVHCRKAVDDLLPIFQSSSISGSRFVFHCFTETETDARKILDFGSMISFTGVVTYKNAEEVLKAAKVVPFDRMMVETDAPYLSPEPVRKMHPNVPKNVIYTANRLAEIRGVSETEMERQLDENAMSFFRISRQLDG